MVIGDLHPNDGHGEGDLLQLTGVLERHLGGRLLAAGAGSQRGVNLVPLAGLDAVTGEDGDGDHGADEGHIEDDGHGGEEGHPSHAAGEKGAQEGVEGASTRETLDGSHPLRDLLFMFALDGQEV